MSKPDKSGVRTQLFSLFLGKLKENTSLIEQYGESPADPFRSLNYATAVRYEMLNAEQDERFKKQIPSAHTLLRWLQRGNFSEQVQSRSVLAVARYLGYQHFDDFQKSIAIKSHSVLTETSVSPITQTPRLVAEELPATSRFSKRGIWGGIVGAILLTFVAYSVVVAISETKSAIPHPSELQVERLIEGANDFEYKLYAQVGRQTLDTNGLHLLFTKEAPAWQTIDKVLQGSIASNHSLNLDRSNRTLISVEIQQVTDSTVVVGTREAWTILWESDVATNTRYDEINEQYYTLRREGDRWKIHKNVYEGVWKPVEE